MGTKTTSERCAACQPLRAAAEQVVARWTSGDLAEAVRALAGALDATSAEAAGTHETRSAAHLVRQHLTVQRRPLLVSGTFGTDAAGIRISVDAEQDVRQQAIALWHEVIHLLLAATGHNDHDEYTVESMARALAGAVPEIATVLFGGAEVHAV